MTLFLTEMQFLLTLLSMRKFSLTSSTCSTGAAAQAPNPCSLAILPPPPEHAQSQLRGPRHPAAPPLGSH